MQYVLPFNIPFYGRPSKYLTNYLILYCRAKQYPAAYLQKIRGHFIGGGDIILIHFAPHTIQMRMQEQDTSHRTTGKAIS